MFGFIECEHDPETAGLLFDAAAGWLRERGRERVVGPMDFSTNDECGLLVEGYDRRPLILQPWHPPYYRELIEGCGMTKSMDLLMWWLELGSQMYTDEGFHPMIHELARKVPRSTGSRSATCARRTSRPRWVASSRSTTRPGRRTGASSRSPRRRSVPRPPI